MKPPLKGWRYAAFIGGFVSLIGIAVYPVVIYPLLHANEYKEIQKLTRRGIDQESVQPGGMKIWSDPFGRK
uniref:Putative secreted protein n=1 Tax=Ornithodoros turicata TaxID=34597 RepID=A0A2R5LHA0_9ACAR